MHVSLLSTHPPDPPALSGNKQLGKSPCFKSKRVVEAHRIQERTYHGRRFQVSSSRVVNGEGSPCLTPRADFKGRRTRGSHSLMSLVALRPTPKGEANASTRQLSAVDNGSGSHSLD